MDAQIIEKLTKLMDQPDFSYAVSLAESTADFIELFRKYGIEVTETELNEVFSRVPLGDGGELKEDDLEYISGGGIVSSLWARIRAILYRGGGGGFSSCGGGGSSFGVGGGGGGMGGR